MAQILWSAQYHVGCTALGTPIATELMRRGHEVTVLAPPRAEAMFRHLGFDFRPSQRFPDIDFSAEGAMTRTSGERMSTAEYMRWWRDLVHHQFTDALGILLGDGGDLVLGESCMQLCGHGLAAQRVGVPWVSYVNFLIDETAPRGPDFPELWNEFRASFGLSPERRDDGESFWFPFSPELVLYLVHAGFAPDGVAFPAYVHRVGPPHTDPSDGAPHPAWLAGLGRSRPAVLVSTSSLWLDDLDVVTLTAEALADADVDVVATISGTREVPPLPGNVIVTGGFPHDLLMPHVSAVVCSAGLGTVTRALSAGTPVVVVPRGGDGYGVAAAVAEQRLGVAIHPKSLTAAAIGRAVEDALRPDMEMRTAVERFRRRGPGDGVAATAADLIEAQLA